MTAVALLAALPYLVHGGLRTFIAFDDDTYVYRNPAVLQGITGGSLRWALITFDSGNWHPLTWLSHLLDVQLFGSAAWGHHLTSVLLHALNTALLFLALARLTGALWRSGFAAAFFGVHPLRVESVAWVAERKDVLSGLFFLLVLLAYERYARRGGAGRYLLVAGLLALGLMAKPMLVTAPFVLLLLDWWPLGRTRAAEPEDGGPRSPRPWRRLVVEKMPLLALSVVSSVVTFLAQREIAAVKDLALLSFGERLANALIAYTGYLGKTVWPAALAVLYPHPLQMPPWWQVAGAFLLLASVTLAAAHWAGRRPALAVGWLWFLGMLVPVIGLVQVGEQALADRYTYLPALGLGLLLCWGPPEAFLRRQAAALATGAGLLLCGLLVAATAQVGRWKNSETLFRHTLAITSRNWLILNNLGALLTEEGRGGEAIPRLEEALQLQPSAFNARYNLGRALANAGRLPEAIAQYQHAVRLRPEKFEVYNSLGVALARTDRFDEAIFQFRNALRLQPETPGVHYNLGMALAGTGQFAGAIEHFQEALRLRPEYPECRRQLELARARASPVGR